jgi:hypothetical protein
MQRAKPGNLEAAVGFFRFVFLVLDGTKIVSIGMREWRTGHKQ